MNLIFMNSFERAAGQGHTAAKIVIGEYQGVLRLLWDEPEEGGKPGGAVWFEGEHWGEMLDVFKIRVRDKIREGFVPLVRDYLGEQSRTSGKMRMLHLLHFYAERNHNTDVLESLKAWRREQAAKENKAAYMVASNRVLQMIACYLPVTAEELAKIPGIGTSGTERYAEAILTHTQGCAEGSMFPLAWVADAAEGPEFDVWLVQQQDMRERQKLAKEEDKLRLLEAISRGETLEAMSGKLTMRRREIVLAVERLDKEGYDVGSLVDAELDGINPQEREEVDKLFREIGDRYLKPVMQRLYPEQQPQGQELDRVYEWIRLYRMKYRKQTG
jgi:hypothetical protein